MLCMGAGTHLSNGQEEVMAETFQKGDVVQLKSGGPGMTIQGDNYGAWQCVCFVGKELKTGSFASETLVKGSANEPFVG